MNKVQIKINLTFLVKKLQLYRKYILNKTLVAFAGVASILVLLVWFSRIISFISYVTENGVGLGQFLSLFLLILPWLLLFIIPISLFIAVLTTYSRLISSNEITILKNSGLTKIAISSPVALIATASSLFCFVISFYLMPYANKQLRLSRHDLRNNYANIAFNSQTFETIGNLTIYTRNRDENNNLSSILLHDRRPEGYSITITAKHGSVVVADDAVLLQMEDGTVQRYSYALRKTEILNFDSYVFNLTESHQNNDSMRWKVKERYLHELINPGDGFTEAELGEFRSEIHQRFTNPLLPIVFSIIAMAWILHGQFNRHGSKANVVMASLMAVVFLGLNMICHDIIESKPALAPLLYLNIISFTLASLRMLIINSRGG